MAAAATDLLQEVGLNTATTLAAPGYTIGDTSITVAATTNMPTTTGITVAIDVVDSDGVQVAGSYNEYVGTVSGGTSITNFSHQNGTNRNYAAGATTRVYMPVSAERENRIVEWGLEEHNQDGTHGAVTATTLTTTGKVTAGSSLEMTAGTLTLPALSINQTALPLGAVVQRVGTGFSAVGTTTTLIPNDDTIPQITEGAEFMTQAITPKSATNILVIEVSAMLSTNAANNPIGALFQDATANALAASIGRDAAGATPTMNVLRHTMVAGTTSATTFRFRSGPAAAGTLTFNGAAGARLFGAITKSVITITEYKAS